VSAAANEADPTKQAIEARLRRAYEATQLRQNGITFEEAREHPHFAVALVNIAAQLPPEPR